MVARLNGDVLVVQAASESLVEEVGDARGSDGDARGSEGDAHGCLSSRALRRA